MNSCASVVPIAGLSTTLKGVNHFIAPQAGPCSTLFFTVSCDWPAATATVSAVSSKLMAHGRDLHDLGDEPAREFLCQFRQRYSLRGGGTLVDVDDRAHKRRRLAANLADAEIAIAGHGGHHAQAVEDLASVDAGVDPPRHHGLPAYRLGFAAHDAAAGEHLGRAGFDVLADDGAGPGGGCGEEEGGDKGEVFHGVLAPSQS